MARKYLDVAFTPAVLQAQERYFGRSRPAAEAPAVDPLGPQEQAFIAARDSFYMATVTESGWPYLQHRGGPSGFLRVLDASTLVFADYEGNHQMISTGNLSVNDRVALFLMDYPNRARLKLFGHARVEDAHRHPELVQQMADGSSSATIQRLLFVDVVSFDWNCPKYITPRFTAAQVEGFVGPLRQQIAELQAQLSQRAARSNRGT